MINLSREIILLFENKGFAVISSLTQEGKIHCSVKGFAEAERQGKIYFTDLFRTNTFHNLQNNSIISVTVIDERQFIGFTLKGKGKIVEIAEFNSELIRKWNDVVVQRASKRVLRDIREEHKNSYHPEALFPKVQYIIEIEVEDIVDLTPAHLKRPTK